MELSIVIPCYNETSRSGLSLTDRVYNICNYLFGECFDFEIILVSDGSTDGTSSEIKSLSKSLPYIKNVCYTQNKGKGYAIKMGVEKVTKSVTLIMDADLSVDISNIRYFYSRLGKVVIGARKTTYIAGSNRDIVSGLSKCCMHKVLGLDERDTQCGFKLLKSDILKDFCSNFQTCNKWLFDAELLVYSHQNSITVKSVDIDWNNSNDTRVRLISGVLTSSFELLIIFFRKKHYKKETNCKY